MLLCLQVITSMGELVEMCSPQILSGWRPLFSALRTVHSSKTDTKDYLLGEYSMGIYDKPTGKTHVVKFIVIMSPLCELFPFREVPGASVRRL